MPATTRARSRVATLAAGLLLSAATLLPVSASAQAPGRATVSADNHLVTAFGTPLRGAPFFLDVYSTWDYNGGMVTKLDTYRQYFLQAASDNNLSAVRCAPGSAITNISASTATSNSTARTSTSFSTIA